MSQQMNILIFDEEAQISRTTRRYANTAVSFEDGYPVFESPFRQNANRAALSQTARVSSPSFSAGVSRKAPAASPFVADRYCTSAQVNGGDMPVAHRVFADAQNDAASQDDEKTPLRSRFDALRKIRVKAKAKRAFTKQYGDVTQHTDTGKGASRAAVYKGEMGAKHKRAVRMQNNPALSIPGASGFPLRKFQLFKSTKCIVALCVVACFVLSCVSLYPSARQYYLTVREHDRLAAEYAAVEERNEALQNNVSALQTDAGVEARAHEQFGWVKQGEQTANVRGLGLEKEEASAFHAKISPESVTAPETWYSPFLDAFFGVE